MYKYAYNLVEVAHIRFIGNNFETQKYGYARGRSFELRVADSDHVPA
jgi:hypothetical protein